MIIRYHTQHQHYHNHYQQQQVNPSKHSIAYHSITDLPDLAVGLPTFVIKTFIINTMIITSSSAQPSSEPSSLLSNMDVTKSSCGGRTTKPRLEEDGGECKAGRVWGGGAGAEVEGAGRSGEGEAYGARVQDEAGAGPRAVGTCGAQGGLRSPTSKNQFKGSGPDRRIRVNIRNATSRPRANTRNSNMRPTPLYAQDANRYIVNWTMGCCTMKGQCIV